MKKHVYETKSGCVVKGCVNINEKDHKKLICYSQQTKNDFFSQKKYGKKTRQTTEMIAIHQNGNF